MLFSEPKIPQSYRAVGSSRIGTVSVLFSEPKIPQCLTAGVSFALPGSFSALQRAENSSIAISRTSGSRACWCFSALQRAENSSIATRDPYQLPSAVPVSVLFSEPKIPQFTSRTLRPAISISVSVLFSEPKIPQFLPDDTEAAEHLFGFSALQRAENSSIQRCDQYLQSVRVSVLFSEPKIPQSTPACGNC